MPILKQTAPASAFKALASWMSYRIPKKTPLWIKNTYKNSTPHKIFTIEPAEFINDKSFKSAEVVGWRFIQKDEFGELAAFEVRKDPQDDFAVHSVHIGPKITEIRLLIIEIIESLKDKKTEYELAMFHSVEMRISAIWLRAKQRKNDIFWPLSPAFYGLVAGKSYTTDEFVARTRNEAASFIKAYKQVSDPMMGI